MVTNTPAPVCAHRWIPAGDGHPTGTYKCMNCGKTTTNRETA